MLGSVEGVFCEVVRAGIWIGGSEGVEAMLALRCVYLLVRRGRGGFGVECGVGSVRWVACGVCRTESRVD